MLFKALRLSFTAFQRLQQRPFLLQLVPRHLFLNPLQRFLHLAQCGLFGLEDFPVVRQRGFRTAQVLFRCGQFLLGDMPPLLRLVDVR